MNDPKGYYATLGVDPRAPASRIHGAFRAKAKLLHPDVPGTGNAGAFLQIREAYDVLSNALRRGEYDRAANEAALQAASWPRPSYTSPPKPNWAPQAPDVADISDLDDLLDPLPEAPRPFVLPFRLPTMMLALLILVMVTGIAGAVWQFTRPQPQATSTISNRMGGVLPDSPPAEDPGPPHTGTPGTPEYVLPVAGTATLWRYDMADRHYRPQARLAPFTPLSLLRLVAHGGMAEVRLADDRVGYVYPHLLAGGDATEAMRARCIYNAGAPPRSGERLDQQALDDPTLQSVKAPSPARVTVMNGADAAVVFVLRAQDGAAAMYLAPHAQAVLTGLPTRRWRVEYAIGDLWSRACFRFMAGMRAQRLPDLPLADSYVIPAARATDITDDAFKRP